MSSTKSPERGIFLPQIPWRHRDSTLEFRKSGDFFLKVPQPTPPTPPYHEKAMASMANLMKVSMKKTLQTSWPRAIVFSWWMKQKCRLARFSSSATVKTEREKTLKLTRSLWTVSSPTGFRGGVRSGADKSATFDSTESKNNQTPNPPKGGFFLPQISWRHRDSVLEFPKSGDFFNFFLSLPPLPPANKKTFCQAFSIICSIYHYLLSLSLFVKKNITFISKNIS